MPRRSTRSSRTPSYARSAPGAPTASANRSPVRLRKGPLLLVAIVALLICGAIGNLTRSQKLTGQTPPTQQTRQDSGSQAQRLSLTQATSTPDEQSLLAGPLPETAQYIYIPETAHSITTFADLFQQMGGVPGIGYPLTEPFAEQHIVDGKWRWVQYFEKAVVEYHPDLPDPNKFQVAALGAARLSERYHSGVAVPATKPVPGDDEYTFPETRHLVRGVFLARWHAGGELRRSGYPLTESFEEVSDADAKPYVVQYFERAVMEYHPEEQPPYDVQLTALGARWLALAYPEGAPRNASGPVPSPTINTGATQEAEEEIAQATSDAEEQIAGVTRTAQALEAHATRTAEAHAQATEDAQQVRRQLATATAEALKRKQDEYNACPSGARRGAVCNDGSSSSATGRGACSHHGGVSYWLYCP